MARNRLIDDVDKRLLRTAIAAAAVCLITFLITRLWLLILDGPSSLDIWLSVNIRQPHPSQALEIVEHVADLPGSGKGAVALILVVGAWAWLRRRDLRPGVLLVGAYVVTKASVEVLKMLLVHVMPTAPIGERVNVAFLSTHVAVAVAMLGMLVVVIWLSGYRNLFPLAVALAVVLVFAVALSVMATDRHYFVDVISGAAIGGFWVAVLTPVADLMWKRLAPPISRSATSSREAADQAFPR